MAQDQGSIHDFDFKLICEYFATVARQGPGSKEVTLQALSFIDNLTSESVIADIGCGTGGQTMVLAENTSGSITGIDLFAEFIDIFNRNARQKGLQNRLRGLIGSMEALPFANNELDVLWSEGAIYNIGFKRGINEWRKFIKTGGYLAVSEASWFTDKRPAELEKYWTDAYPEIDTVGVKVCQLQEAGYIPTATFILPENCWIDNFYVPQIKAQEEFLTKYKGNSTAEDLVKNQRFEAEMYATYKKYYGYVFYIGKKI